MNVPNAFAAFTIFKGDITKVDYLHLVRESDGGIPGWIDELGIPQGTLATGGGGGSSVFIEGSLILDPNFLPGTGINFSVAGSDITISATGSGGIGTSFMTTANASDTIPLSGVLSSSYAVI